MDGHNKRNFIVFRTNPATVSGNGTKFEDETLFRKRWGVERVGG